MDKVIAINANVFIIPNKFRLVRDLPTYIRSYFKEVSKLNNLAITNVDKIVEVWFLTNDDDNLGNGFTMEVEGRNYYFDSIELTEVPADLFNGVKEGDVVKYMAPVKAIDPTGKEVNMVLDINMTCQQRGYRYGSFGTFEEVLWEMTHDKVEDIQRSKNISTTTNDLNEITTNAEHDEEIGENLNYNKMKRGNVQMKDQTENINAGASEELSKTATKETKEENKKEEGKSIMKSIKERWNNLPKGVKTGAKIVAGVVVVAAVAYVGNEGYKRYINKDDSCIEIDEVIVVDDIDEAIVADNDDDFVVIVSE